MNIDCNRENRKLLKRISISDREELMEDMNLRAVFGRKWRFERNWGKKGILKWGSI